QKSSRCERVSSVVPDFDEATKSVRSRSCSSTARRIAPGWVVSSTCTASLANVRRSTSGARLEPPIPITITASKAESASCANASSWPTRSCIRSGSSSQPSQRFSSAPVQTVASRAQMRSTRSAVSTLATRREPLRGDELARLRLQALDQLPERLGELLDTLTLERLDDVVVVDPGLRKALECPLRLVDPLLERRRDLPVILEGLDRLLRHRVDRHRADQVLDVHHVGIVGVLRRRGGPQAALRRRPLGGEELPALSREELLVALV